MPSLVFLCGKLCLFVRYNPGGPSIRGELLASKLRRITSADNNSKVEKGQSPPRFLNRSNGLGTSWGLESLRNQMAYMLKPLVFKLDVYSVLVSLESFYPDLNKT